MRWFWKKNAPRPVVSTPVRDHFLSFEKGQIVLILGTVPATITFIDGADEYDCDDDFSWPSMRVAYLDRVGVIHHETYTPNMVFNLITHSE